MDENSKMTPNIETSTVSPAPKVEAVLPSNYPQHPQQAQTEREQAELSVSSPEKGNGHAVSENAGILEKGHPGSIEVSEAASRTVASQEQQTEMLSSAAINSVTQEPASTEASAAQGSQVETTSVVNGDTVPDNEGPKPTPMVPAIPPKRGRGRPRKYPRREEANGSVVTTLEAPAASTTAETSTSTVPIPSKRGPGRPPRNPAVGVAKSPRRIETQPRNRLLEMHPLETSVIYQPKRQRIQRIAYEPNFEPTYQRQKREPSRTPKQAPSKNQRASEQISSGTPKRGRGRPRKQVAIVSEERQMPVESPVPVKRKRGRPPKHPVLSADIDSPLLAANTTSTVIQVASPAPKKRRGRPPKHPVSPAKVDSPPLAAETSTVTQVSSPAPKKRRGRPPKRPLPTMTVVEARGTSEVVAKNPPIKKKRGRPPKQRVTVKAKTNSGRRSGLQSMPPSETKRGHLPKLQAIAPTKKKRGRPPKQPVGGPKLEPTTVAAVVPPVKRKRGRPPKNPPGSRRASSKKVVAGAEVALASPFGPPSITESTTTVSTPGLTSNSPVARKRGRPRKKPRLPQGGATNRADVLASPLSPAVALSPSVLAKPEEVDAAYHQVAAVDPLVDSFSYFPAHAELPFPLLGSSEQDDVALADPIIGVSM